MSEDLYAIFQKAKNPTAFEAIRIKLASPERIREWSYGEVKKPETINYRTFKPERDGLFCAKIFGPIMDWECICGKYRRMKHRGIVCDKCGVEVIQSKVRRERLGHIELATPVSHIWYLKGKPSIIGILLDMSTRDLEKVLYFESYIVIDPGETPLKTKELLGDEDYKKKVAEYGSKFKAGMGAEAIRELLKVIDLEVLSGDLTLAMRQTSSISKRDKLARRLRITKAFRKSENKPEWMIMDVISVLPPDLRPLVPLEGGRFATSDLNDLYRRVINRNNRLKRLVELKAPSVIIKNEKKQLQEAVDALFDNGRRSKVLKTATKRPLKSLSDMIKGKQGRFRQNLLGKRVDYSGRSVIVPGPELKLHQCGLPKKMAIELFKAFIFSKLEEKGHATTIKAAKKLVEKESLEVWDALEEVVNETLILLNRQPTLHRLGFQAFQPILDDGKSIRLHPLVCKAFNADFDGDQIAVHVPLSMEAQIESRLLMMSANNILSPANGKAIIAPTQDVVLGVYYLTKEDTAQMWRGQTFAGMDDVRIAFDSGVISIHSKIRVRFKGDIVETTTGRVLLKEILPCGFPFSMIDKIVHNKDIDDIIAYLHREFGPQDCVEFLNKLVSLGFEYATQSGISCCMDDFVLPENRDLMIRNAREAERAYRKSLLVINIDDGDEEEGCLDDNTRAIVELWNNTSEKMENEVRKEYEKADSSFNSIYMMVCSGARGHWKQLAQISGMYGNFVQRGTARTISSNYRQGLTSHEFYMAASSSIERLSMVDPLIANTGYLLRKLVHATHDVVVEKEDCGTNAGIIVSFIKRSVGRVAAEEIRDPATDDLLLPAGKYITHDISDKIVAASIKEIKIRSVLTCISNQGICSKCYGWDLSADDGAEVGEAVGIIAAQSIEAPMLQALMNSRLRQDESNFLISSISQIIALFEARLPKDYDVLSARKILDQHGLIEAQLCLLNELQAVFGALGICVNNKHFEVIIRKMTEKIRIDDPGDSTLLKGELVEKNIFYAENANTEFEGGRPVRGKQILQGVTKAAMSGKSWVANAAFQNTTKILTEAAISGMVDELSSLQENVIVGRLISAGTGHKRYTATFVKRGLRPILAAPKCED